MGLSNEFRIKFHWDHKSADYVYNLLFGELQCIHGNVMLVGLSNTYIYKKFLEQNHTKIDTLYIVDDYGMNYFVNSLNYVDVKIYFINTDKFIAQKHMPKFDYIIQNPPYNKSLHLDFFNKGLDLLNDTGKMVIVEPSTWLLSVRTEITSKPSSTMKKYKELKNRISGHVKKVIFENYNIQFHTNNYMPFSITWIDKGTTYKNFEFINCGIVSILNNINDCNNIGKLYLIQSIFEKISKFDTVENHLYIPYSKNKSIFSGKYYCKFPGIIGGSGSNQCAMSDAGRNLKITIENYDPITNANICYSKTDNFGEILNCFVWTLYHRNKNNIQDTPVHRCDRGNKITDKEAENICGTKEELENLKVFTLRNSLPLFINICMIIDQHNNSLPYIPWLVDKQYTDEEIYKLFNFSKEEIELIENTIKRYERYSPWFKRYMTGDTSIEINQKYPWLEKDA